MDYSQYANSAYGYPPGYTNPYAQQAQQQQAPYQQAPPTIRNPFAPPPPPRTQFAGQNAQYDPEREAQLAQWQSNYIPQDQQDRGRKGGKDGKAENANHTPIGVRGQASGQTTASTTTTTTTADQTSARDGKKQTVLRKGGGETWEDRSLLEWDPLHFRIMVGNLAGEVTDESLAKAFAAYGVSKARVVRDKRTTKSKGFGFVSFPDSEQGFKAAREMSGKYIGSHPVIIKRSTTDVRATEKKENDGGKGKNKGKGKNHNDKNKDKGKQDDPLRAHTGAHIEKKPVKNFNGLKMLG